MKKKLDEKIIQKIMSSHIPVPMCIVSSGGKIIGANEHMDQVFLYGDLENADFFQLTGVKVSDLMEDLAEEKSGPKTEGRVIERNGKKFSVIAVKSSLLRSLNNTATSISHKCQQSKYKPFEIYIKFSVFLFI